VGLWEWSMAALSSDEGKTWTKPVKVSTLVMAGAKIWGQKTSDGRYALIYNPVSEEAKYSSIPPGPADGMSIRFATPPVLPFGRVWRNESQASIILAMPKPRRFTD